MALLAPRRRRSLRLLPVLVGFGVLGLLAVTLVPSLNPFAETTRDRSQPALLRSLEDLAEYRAASANLQVIVDVERDGPLPGFLKGERTLLVAAGTVDAAVDFRSLERGAVRVSRDRLGVSLTLPAARLTETRLDPSRTRVYDRDRGLLDRVGDAVGDDPVDDQALYVLAERRLREGAATDPALPATAQRNTRSMLEGLLRGLGFERIEIAFRRPPV